TTRLLHLLIREGNRYFVRQTYPRGLNPLDTTQKAAFLFTHYKNLADAQQHWNALLQDPNRFLYDSGDPEHFARLEIAARQPLGFPVYTPLLEKPWQASDRMKELIRK